MASLSNLMKHLLIGPIHKLGREKKCCKSVSGVNLIKLFGNKFAHWTIFFIFGLFYNQLIFFSVLGKDPAYKIVPYFIKYNAHTSIVRTWISQWFLAKNLFLFFKNNFKINNYCKFNHHERYLKTFLSYLPCIARKEYFSIIFNAKKCTLYSIK